MFNYLINPEYAHSVAISNTYTGEPAPCIRRWVDGVEQVLPHRFECLVCGCDFPADDWNVCPHCGAVGDDLVEYTEVGA